MIRVARRFRVLVRRQRYADAKNSYRFGSTRRPARGRGPARSDLLRRLRVDLGRHNFPRDFPSVEMATGFMSMMLSRPDIYSVVAEEGGRIVGSNFLWQSDAIAGVGPITVDPTIQNSKIGRTLMTDVLRRADEAGSLSVRLVQAAFHNRSLALYTKLGFDTVEPLSCIQGPSGGVRIEGHKVRKMTVDDLPAVDALAFRVHGHTRHNEVAVAVAQGSAKLSNTTAALLRTQPA